mmetsp:Transcript_12412/g.23268  ORF Transcript_12412/g.23268 Transcript_12412/m.23268 type:complete len:589 (+) Transcript_12412:173-1939(+)
MRTLLYVSLIILRLIAVLQPGYIHPDELFQGGQELFFGCPNDISHLEFLQDDPQSAPFTSSSSTKQIKRYNHEGALYVNIIATWEFQKANAVRSSVPPSFMTVLPLWIYCKLRQWCSGAWKSWTLSGWEILTIPRLFMALLSIVAVDFLLYFIVRKRETWISNNNQIKKGVPIELLIFASSWTTVCFLTRPFSNSLETFCISLLCAVSVIDMEGKRLRYQSFLVPLLTGIVCSVGLFVRFTFVIFALPVVLAILLTRFEINNATMYAKIKSVLSCILLIAIPFLVTSSFFVCQDVNFYSSQSDNGPDLYSTSTKTMKLNNDFRKYVAPWNASRYNSKMENLAEHGLHPRITHIVVNLPMLFGPVAIYFYVSMLKTIGGGKDSKQSRMDNMLRGMIVFGLAMLSSAPHQEPRFLLPLVIPLILLHARDLYESESFGNVFMVIWIIFNMLLMVFFGGLHQGAVLSSVMSLPDILHKSSMSDGIVIYYNTYMPPTFLLRRHSLNLLTAPQNNQAVSPQTCPSFIVFDAQSSRENVLELLSKRFSCRGEEYQSSVYLVAPPVKTIQDFVENSVLSVNIIELVSTVCKSNITT